MQSKFFGLKKTVNWVEKSVRKLLTVWKEELRIVPSNNLRGNICVLFS